jgi:hypothetical protein
MKIIPVFVFLLMAISAQSQQKAKVLIQYTPGHPANVFVPSALIGGAFDGHEKGDMDRMLSKESIEAMHTVGLRPLSYRLRTELGGEVWHWNPQGTWSEKGKQEGYWVSDSVSSKPIWVSNGYRLPRRGNSIDQANDDGYSRLDDGDAKTFWKSSPYLDEHFTCESNDLHPQWAIIDLGVLRDVNTIRISWGNPYAASFTIDYALDIGSDYFEPFQPGLWRHFPVNQFQNLNGGDQLITVSRKPVRVRFIRLQMTKTKYAGKESMDIRDQLGFAIKELKVGFIDASGSLHDWVHHSPDHKRQSTAYVSSTDPWHRAIDLDPNTEQAGIDRFFTSGLTAGQPVMMPVGLLYDTPENSEAMVRYLNAKQYAVSELEMGEEPEGQLISPMDYGSLYYQWGKRLKALFPGLKFGGPGFATLSFTEDDADTFTESTWTKHFLDYLRKQNRLDLFNFFSFEWYPFNDLCEPTAPQLAVAPQMLDIALKNLRNAGMPAGTPMMLTEYGYSAFEGKPEVEMEGALMYADILGKFLAMGGNKSFLYGYEPAYLEQTGDCGYGNNILFGLNENTGKIKYRTAAYYGMQMLTHNWVQPVDGQVEMYEATSNVLNKDGLPLITAYPVKKLDGRWSVVLINKDPKKTYSVNVALVGSDLENPQSLRLTEFVQYSGQQYRWVNKGTEGHPSLSLPPVKKDLNNSEEILLPPYSLTVVQGK